MARARSSQQSVGDGGFVLLDAEGRITRMDEGALQIAGRDNAYWTGRGLHELLLPVAGTAGPGRPERLPLGAATVIAAPDGTRKLVVATLEWAPAGVKVHLQDAPAHRTGIQDMERLQKAQELSGIGTWELHVPSDTLWCSPHLVAMLGLDPAEGGRTDLPFFERFVHEDDLGRLHKVREQAIADQEPREVDIRIVRKDGAERTLDVRLDAEFLDGELQAIFGVARDVTDERATERRFEQLLEGSPDPIVVTGPDGTIRFVNKMLENVFGFEPEDLLGKRIEALVPAALRDKHRQHRADYMEHAKPRPMGAGLALKALHKDGHEVPVEISLSPLQTAEGTMVMAAVRDVTERRKAEEADRLAFERLIEIQQLREADRAKTTLLNIASHELKTPLTPLRLQLYLLDSERLGPLTEKQRHAVDVLKRNTDRLSSLIADVLDMARLEGGRIKLEPQPVSLRRLIKEAMEPFEEAVRAAGLKIKASVDDVTMLADPERAVQIVINFISNAVKFSKEGGRIEVRASKDGDDVLIEVQDSGPGISPEMQAQLFQPFVQVHDPGKTSERGTGLGLYICRGIAEKHGGTVGVHSEGEGKGSTFWCRLPAVKEGLDVRGGPQ